MPRNLNNLYAREFGFRDESKLKVEKYGREVQDSELTQLKSQHTLKGRSSEIVFLDLPILSRKRILLV
jgi:hypothetical protein